MSWPVSWPFPATMTASPARALPRPLARWRPRGRARRRSPPRTHPGAPLLRAPCSHLGQDLQRVLRTRVVAGEDRHIRADDGGGSHQRPLARGHGLPRSRAPRAAGRRPARAPSAAGSPPRPACGRSRRVRGTAARRRSAPSVPARPRARRPRRRGRLELGSGLRQQRDRAQRVAHVERTRAWRRAP